MNTKVGQFSDLMPDEIKMIFKDSPRDHIDWALVMYLFRHSKFPYGYGLIFDEKNVITIGKISKWFDLDYDDVYRRLKRQRTGSDKMKVTLSIRQYINWMWIIERDIDIRKEYRKLSDLPIPCSVGLLPKFVFLNEEEFTEALKV